MTPRAQASGVDLIVNERLRQIAKEGYDAGHDDNPLGHGQGQIAFAAMTYLMANRTTDNEFLRRFYWPWQRHEFKPDTPVRNLVKAGALIAAEIDRLLRIEEEK